MKDKLGEFLKDYGITVKAMNVQIALPEAVLKAIDERATMGAMGGSIPGSMTGSMPSITTVGADGSRSTYTMAAQPLVRNLPLDQAATLSGDA